MQPITEMSDFMKSLPRERHQGTISPSMAAFPAVLIDQPVLLTYVEWCETAHSAVIGMDQALLKCGSRPHPLNYQLDPPGGIRPPYPGLGRRWLSLPAACLKADVLQLAREGIFLATESSQSDWILRACTR